MQFVRYTAELKRRGAATVRVQCRPPLAELLATATGVDGVVGSERPPAHDFWVFALSLPHLLAARLDTIPAALPYVRAGADRLATWAPRLPPGPRIGLVWKGSPDHANDAQRSLGSLSALAPLWSVPGVSFVSLQHGLAGDEAQELAGAQPLWHLGGAIADFADLAAVVAQLDLVICVDTAVAHVAGALGQPVWVMLPAARTDWRWLEGRTDSPWYPGVMRLWRQAHPGAWAPVVDRIAQALPDWLSKEKRP